MRSIDKALTKSKNLFTDPRQRFILVFTLAIILVVGALVIFKHFPQKARAQVNLIQVLDGGGYSGYGVFNLYNGNTPTGYPLSGNSYWNAYGGLPDKAHPIWYVGDKLISALDGADVVIKGDDSAGSDVNRTVILDGNYHFHSLKIINHAQLTHSVESRLGGLHLVVDGDVTIDPLSKIDVSKKGFRGGNSILSQDSEKVCGVTQSFDHRVHYGGAGWPLETNSNPPPPNLPSGSPQRDNGLGDGFLFSLWTNWNCYNEVADRVGSCQRDRSGDDGCPTSCQEETKPLCTAETRDSGRGGRAGGDGGNSGKTSRYDSGAVNKAIFAGGSGGGGGYWGGGSGGYGGFGAGGSGGEYTLYIGGSTFTTMGGGGGGAGYGGVGGWGATFCDHSNECDNTGQPGTSDTTKALVNLAPSKIGDTETLGFGGGGGAALGVLTPGNNDGYGNGGGHLYLKVGGLLSIQSGGNSYSPVSGGILANGGDPPNRQEPTSESPEVEYGSGAGGSIEIIAGEIENCGKIEANGPGKAGGGIVRINAVNYHVTRGEISASNTGTTDTKGGDGPVRLDYQNALRGNSSCSVPLPGGDIRKYVQNGSNENDPINVADEEVTDDVFYINISPGIDSLVSLNDAMDSNKLYIVPGSFRQNAGDQFGGAFNNYFQILDGAYAGFKTIKQLNVLVNSSDNRAQNQIYFNIKYPKTESACPDVTNYVMAHFQEAVPPQGQQPILYDLSTSVVLHVTCNSGPTETGIQGNVYGATGVNIAEKVVGVVGSGGSPIVVNGAPLDRYDSSTKGGGNRYSINGASTANWQKLNSLPKNVMTDRINKLLTERAKKIDNASKIPDVLFKMNCITNGVLTDNNNCNLQTDIDGNVYTFDANNRDVTISGSTINGKGTIIIENSTNVKIDSKLQYGDDSGLPANKKNQVAIVVMKGNLTFTGNAKDLSGLYYVPNGDINGDPVPANSADYINFTGLMMANTINITRSKIFMGYDGKVVNSPPPGFYQILDPNYKM